MNNTYPSIEQAKELLAWAENKNPGVWADHSRTTGRAAQVIAEACGLNGDLAHTLGLLHDVGRFEGVRQMHHIIAGYKLLKSENLEINARICLTHSFVLKDINEYSGNNDCSEEETKFIIEKLNQYNYDDYDRLIQLCDSICLPEGVSLLEVRLMDVARRHGFNNHTLDKWSARFEQKKYFDKLCSQNIYELFRDEIIDNIFN